ncbi:MAG: hypothetical protein KGR26_16690 [Cyanobacteria bacterium REEB65]|nr:hypothetical protein [Cyanobacteria bacterium REEB65]
MKQDSLFAPADPPKEKPPAKPYDTNRNITDRAAILEEIMDDIKHDTTAKERAITLSLKDHEPYWRPIATEDMFRCTFPGCGATGRENVPTLRGLSKTGAMYAGCRKHRVC